MNKDIIEDDVGSSQSSVKEAQFQTSQENVIDTYKDINSHLMNGSDKQHSNIYEDSTNALETDDLKWKQIKHPDASEPAMSSSPKFDSNRSNSSKRQSPVGDDALSNFVEPRPSSIPPYRSDLVGEIVEKSKASPSADPIRSQSAERPLSQMSERPMSHTSEIMLPHSPSPHTSERPLSHTPERPLSHTSERPLSHTSERPLSHNSERPLSHTSERPFSHTSERPLSQTSGRDSSSSPRSGYGEVLDDLAAERPRSKVSASPASVLEQTTDPRGSRPPSAGGGSSHGSVHGSSHGSVHGSSHGSVHGSSRPSPAQDVYGRPPLKASDRFSPSVIRDDQPVRLSSRPQSASSSSRFAPASESQSGIRPPSEPSSRPPSLHNAESPVHISSRPASESASRMSNQSGGRVGSRAGSLLSSHGSQGSLSSELELAQYLDPPESGSKSNEIDQDGDNLLTDTAFRSSVGSQMSTSMLNYNQVAPISTNLERRSMTPDNRIRVPPSQEIPAYSGDVVRDSVVGQQSNSASASRLSASSRASGRETVTPTNVENGISEERQAELETQVGNLRKLLMGRESEVHSMTQQMKDLRDINRALKEELEHRRHRHTPQSSETAEFKQLQSEKEILAKEVVSLRESLHQATQESAGSGRTSTSSAISDYSPNSPAVLKRKIADLEGHIRDLQEVNETSQLGVGKAEEKVRRLMQENKELKSRALTVNDLQTGSDQHLRVELRTLRDEVRSLKERNFQLTEENMKLTDGRTDNRGTKMKSPEVMNQSIGPRLSSSLRSDDGIVRNSTSYRRDRDLGPPPSASYFTNQRERLYREDLAPKDLGHSSLSRNPETDTRMLETSARLLSDREKLNSGGLTKERESRLLQDRHRLDPSRLRPKNISAPSSYSDRSRPDGEVSEKLHSDKYAKSATVAPDRRMHNDVLQERRQPSYKDSHTRNRDPLEDSRDKYRHISEWERDAHASTYTAAGTTISSKDNKYISGNLDFQKLSARSDDTANDSDTATDILLAQDGTGARGISHHRGSVESISSLSDVDEPSDTIRRRSKSVDAQRGESSHRQMTTLQRSGSATRPLTSIETARSSAGHRSCLPAPLATQHNKAELNKGLGSLLSSNLTHGMRPFAPRNPSDIRSEDVVKFSRQGGKLTQGMVKFVGHLPGRNEAYLGVELDRDEGKHDGTFEGIRYFKCKPNKGVFVAFNKVVMAWAP